MCQKFSSVYAVVLQIPSRGGPRFCVSAVNGEEERERQIKVYCRQWGISKRVLRLKKVRNLKRISETTRTILKVNEERGRAQLFHLHASVFLLGCCADLSNSPCLCVCVWGWGGDYDCNMSSVTWCHLTRLFMCFEGVRRGQQKSFIIYIPALHYYSHLSNVKQKQVRSLF